MRNKSFESESILRNHKLNRRLKIAFIVSANSSVGSGHLIRSLALANSLTRMGATCVFLNSTLSKEAITMVITAQHKIETLTIEQPDLEYYMTQYLSMMEQKASSCAYNSKKQKPFDVVIVDSYKIDKVTEDRLKTITDYRVVIDDLANRPHSCEMIIDQTPIRETSDYLHLTQSPTKFLIGSEFTLLRPEFAAIRRKNVSRKPRLLNVLVVFGAFDQDGLILKTLNLLRIKRDLKHIQFHIMLSSHSKHINDINSLALDSKSRINLHIDTEKTADLMYEMDLAITAGGLTCLELACLGINSIILPASTIQAAVADELSKHCNFQVIPNWRNEFEKSLLECVDKSMASISNGEVRKFHPKIDGLGTQRVAGMIIHCVQEIYPTE